MLVVLTALIVPMTLLELAALNAVLVLITLISPIAGTTLVAVIAQCVLIVLKYPQLHGSDVVIKLLVSIALKGLTPGMSNLMSPFALMPPAKCDYCGSAAEAGYADCVGVSACAK